MKNISLDLAPLRRLYHSGVSPRDLLKEVLDRIGEWDDPALFTYLMNEAEWEPYLRRLEALEPDSLPLYGVPFVIKDNIDLEGIPTTAGCPAFAYMPKESNPVVQRLIWAGAIPLGKVNLDQFATGLVGVRSPFGIPRNALNPSLIPGGSSSGSAAAVAAGLVSFALGTDTAGSGRIPAAMNGIVGLKPTRGLLSTRGVVPACRSLDCVSIFANQVRDAALVSSVASGFDAEDPYSRRPHPYSRPRTFRLAYPQKKQLQWFGDPSFSKAFDEALARWESLGYALEEMDYAPWLEAAALLYSGPWIAERWAALGEFVQGRGEDVFPLTREILLGGKGKDAAELFLAQQRLESLKRSQEFLWNRYDAVVLPTMGRAFTLEEVAAEPLAVNTQLGYYTNYMNLMDLAGLALPAGLADNQKPFSLTLAGPAWSDSLLLEMGATFRGENHGPDLGALSQPGGFLIGVCGAHMRGLPLNEQLTERGGVFVETAQTAPAYRFYAFDDNGLEKPGLVRAGENEEGHSIALELWSLPEAAWGGFIQLIPPPLGLGTLELQDGRLVKGFLMEAFGTRGARDISSTLGWRNYLEGKGEENQEENRGEPELLNKAT